MAYYSHSVENLGIPFLSVDELVFVIPKGGAMRLSRHHFKLLYILSGEIEHEIEGVDGKRPLKTGDILIAPLVGRHDYINPNRTKAIPMQAVRFFLDAKHLQKRAARRIRKPETDLSDFILHHFPRVVQIEGGIDTEITELLNSFRHETEQRSVGYRHRMQSICTNLIVATARKLSSEPSYKMGKGFPAVQLISAAKEYIFKHMIKDLTLGEIAWHVGKGEEHLARVFKRETGQSVFDYVRELRVSRAKTYLQNPSLSLTKIAEQCGFNSLSFFSRTFRHCVGMSPSDYRKHTVTTVR